MPKPKMKVFGQQRGTKTRPIPLVEYESDKRASRAAAADQKTKAKATRMPQGPRVAGVSEIFGTKVNNTGTGGTYNPTGQSNTV